MCRIVDERALALHLATQPRQQGVERLDQRLELGMAGCHAGCVKVVRLAKPYALGELAQRTQALRYGEPQGHQHQRQGDQQRASQIVRNGTDPPCAVDLRLRHRDAPARIPRLEDMQQLAMVIEP